MNRLSFAAILLLGGCSAVYDIRIVGGTVYDGSGGPGVRADVGLIGDRIVAVGELAGHPAKRRIEASGKVVCPGFIDLHTHSDDPILEDGLRANLSYLTQGCTAVVTGNCGSGHVDVAAYFERLRRQGAGTHVAHLLPHGSIREKAMGGSFNRDPTDEERKKMEALVEQGMRDGAFGLTTGLIYTPGTYAKTEEIVELAKVVARFGGLYASHIRNEGDSLLDAVKEALDIGERAGCPVHISHFKAGGPANWGKVKDAAILIEAARARGQRVTCDQYPYAASSTSLAAMLIPAWAREGRDEDLVRRLDDPEAGPKIRKAVAEALEKRRGPETIVLARYRANETWNGLNLAEAAKSAGKDAVEVVIEIQRNGGAQAIGFGMSEEDVRFVMTLAYVATASDGSSKRPDETRPHPRSYGTFSRKIGRYSIEQDVLPLSQAIRSATGLPADILSLRDRGYLRPGFFADIAVFDPAAFRDRATYADPHQYSTGVEWLFVNGVAAIENGRPTKELAGRVLRVCESRER